MGNPNYASVVRYYISPLGTPQFNSHFFILNQDRLTMADAVLGTSSSGITVTDVGSMDSGDSLE